MPGLRIALHDALCERRVDGALHAIGVIALLNSDGCMTHSDEKRRQAGRDALAGLSLMVFLEEADDGVGHRRELAGCRFGPFMAPVRVVERRIHPPKQC
jgi:hypothetical protein